MKVKNITKRDKVYERRELTYDFLGEWAIVRRWAQINYDLTRAELEMLLFLHKRKLFTRQDFAQFSNFMQWDTKRFDKLLREGWVYIWRQRKQGETNLYEVSFKSKKLITSIYKKLTGLEPIPMSPRRNKAFRKNAPFHQKTLAHAIVSFNDRFKEQQQRPSPVELYSEFR
jgi:hypothetical protein